VPHAWLRSSSEGLRPVDKNRPSGRLAENSPLAISLILPINWIPGPSCIGAMTSRKQAPYLVDLYHELERDLYCRVIAIARSGVSLVRCGRGTGKP
jgi:hypothetical protein